MPTARGGWTAVVRRIEAAVATDGGSPDRWLVLLQVVMIVLGHLQASVMR